MAQNAKNGRQAPPAGLHTNLRLGSLELTVQALGWMRAKTWRQRVLDSIEQLGGLTAGWDDVRLDTPDGIKDVIGRAERLIIAAPDLIFELLMEHDAQFAEHRELLEQEATLTQVARAFKEVLTLEFPLEELRGLLRMTQSGPAAPTISKNSPTRSGASNVTTLVTKAP